MDPLSPLLILTWVLARRIMVFLSISVDEPVVTSVSPRSGGRGGGFKLTIFGRSKFY